MQQHGFRISSQQRRLWWLLTQQHPAFVQHAVLFEGSIDPVRLRQALTLVAERHEALRTTFHQQAGLRVPTQVVGECAALVWQESDLRQDHTPDLQDVLERTLQAERERPFDLAQGPLLHAHLCTLDQGRALLLTMPAISANSTTLRRLLDEAAHIYDDRSLPPEDALVQFLEVLEWQHSLREDAEAEDGRVYWRQQRLAEAPVPALPLAQPTAAPTVPQAPAEIARPLESRLFACLQQLCAAQQVEPAGVLLACWQGLLGRLSGESSGLLGLRCDGRSDPALAGSLGSLERYIPLAYQFDDRRSLVALAHQAGEQYAAAQRWQDTFSWDLLDGGADAAIALPVAFSFEEPPASWAGSGYTRTTLLEYCYRDNIALELLARGSATALTLVFRYDPQRFEACAISDLAARFVLVLEAALEQPELPFGDAALLLPHEQRLLAEFNATQADYPELLCVHQLFEDQVTRTPNALAVLCGGVRLTYAELNARANQLAHALRAAGVTAETRVAVCAGRSVELLVGILGTLKAGAAYVPIDPAYPQERREYMLADSGSRLLLTLQEPGTKNQEPRAEDSGSRFSVLGSAGCVLDLIADWPAIAQQPTANLAPVALPDHLAYVIYTSGSTGRPKGTMIHHRGLVNYLIWCTQVYAVGAGTGAPVHSSIAFDLTVTSLFAPLVAGRPVLLLPETHGSQALIDAFLHGDDYSLLKITPAHLELLNQHLAPAQAAGHARALVIGGEALHAESLAFWRCHAPATRLINEYGPTETVVGCCVYEVDPSSPASGPVPIGRPIANTQLYVLDQRCQPVPPGAAGELAIGGLCVGRGYLGRPDLTAEVFVPDPFSAEPGARMYRSGDLVRLRPDGNLEFLGRKDQQVKLRGFRIELGELETLLRQAPGVRESVAMVREDAPGDKRLVAYFTQEPAGQDSGSRFSVLGSGELRAFLQERLPDYMIPDALVALSSLPLTPNGKVDRQRLPAPARQRSVLDLDFVAPRDQTELQVARIWEDLLRLRPISVTDQFFSIGGHSLLAAQLMVRIQREFGQQLPLSVLSQQATIEHMAGLLRQQSRQYTWTPLIGMQQEGQRPPLFFVHPLGGSVLCYVHLAAALAPDQPFYACQAPGLNGEQPVVTSVAALARLYLEYIRQVAPNGPYHLGGWSFGGAVALEMAHQLEQVALLTIVNSPAPLADFKGEDVSDAALVLKFARSLGGGFGKNLAITREQLQPLSLRDQFHLILDRAHSAQILLPGMEAEQLLTLYQVYKTNVLSFEAYDPPVVVCNIHYVRARQQSEGSQNHALGWSSLSRQPILVSELEGDHYSILAPPLVSALAALLRQDPHSGAGEQAERHPGDHLIERT